MAEREASEADALEQQLESDEDAATDKPLPAEAPEADAIEQHQGPDGTVGEPGAPRVGSEVPEADAVEQAQIVPDDDDAWSE